jgi:excisionase family DNA binding protein
MKDVEQMLTCVDVAQKLNVTRQVVAKWCRDGILRHVRVGKLYRFHRADIDRFTEASTGAGNREEAANA